MKRCPQCEFIYEDDQSLCDMDGVLLVFDSRTLPDFHTLATVPPVPGRAVRRHRMVPAFATILLTLVIASLYYFSPPRSVAPVENFVPPPPNVTAPTPEPVQPQPALVEPAKSEEPPKEPEKPAASPARKATTKPAAVKPAEPPRKKEDSKVGSILKKTGRILKKPFKF